MVAALIIVSVLLILSLALNFLLFKVLKNTLNMVDELIDMAQGRTPRKLTEAYDGKYYPATVIAQIKYDCDSEQVITDFSLYDEKKIVGFIVCTKESLRDHFGPIVDELEEEEDIEDLTAPVILPNVTVYSPREGMWTWK